MEEGRCVRKKEETDMTRKKEREFGKKERRKDILTVTVQIYMYVKY